MSLSGLPNTLANMTKEEELDREGLRVLRWSMFDSPDTPGSGYRFMEREPVVALDRAAHRYEYRVDIVLGYTSAAVANKMRLATTDSHRVGHAVRIRCVGAKKRLKLIRTLMEQGVTRFAVDREIVYFDTDPLKAPEFHIWT